jgi:hypothetical protein
MNQPSDRDEIRRCRNSIDTSWVLNECQQNLGRLDCPRIATRKSSHEPDEAVSSSEAADRLAIRELIEAYAHCRSGVRGADIEAVKQAQLA